MSEQGQPRIELYQQAGGSVANGKLVVIE